MTLLDAAEKPVAGAAIDTAQAEAALAWAEQVGLEGEAALGAAPERPDQASLLALGAARVRDSVGAIITGRNAQLGLDALQHTGVMAAWLPEVEALVGFGDGEWRHKDVWKHTKQVVWQSVPRLEVRWGALLHDIGKVRTRRIDDDGQVHFFGHSEVGARMYRKKVAARLQFSGHLDERIHFLILYHLRASQYEASWTDSAVRRFAKEMGDGLTDLLDLSRADITTKRPERKKRGLRQISDLGDRIEKLLAEDAKPVPLPKGVGNAIMAHFKLPASPRIGEIKRALEERVAAGTLEGGHDSEYYVAWLEPRRDEFGL